MTDLPPNTRVPPGLHDVADRVAAAADRALDDLAGLVRIPSISAPGHDPDPVRRSAERTAELLAQAGLEEVRLLEVDGAHPYVFGAWDGAGDGAEEDAPTVLLYAHHDVQPVGTPGRWTSPPFEPTVREGRLYGRGAADDKAGILVHAVAVASWLRARGALPLRVKVVIEGEEEIGSPHLHEFLARHAGTLRADVIVLTDLPNWKVGWPGLTYALRGIVDLTVTVRALEQPVHSGMWGGPIPDALTGLTRALATLVDDRGRPAVDGLHDDVRPPTRSERERIAALDVDPEELRREARVLDGVEWIGADDAPLLERIWMRPSLNVLAIDAPSVRDASNQLIAEARAKVSMRLAPGQDAQRALGLLAEHLRRAVPWGLHVDVEPGAAVPAWVTEPQGPAFDAAVAAMTAGFGREPALLGCGGTIPFVQPFSDAFGRAPCLLTGIEDPETNAHGEDESLHLTDFLRACLTEAFLFHELAQRATELRGADRGADGRSP